MPNAKYILKNHLRHGINKCKRIWIQIGNTHVGDQVRCTNDREYLKYKLRELKEKTQYF